MAKFGGLTAPSVKMSFDESRMVRDIEKFVGVVSTEVLHPSVQDGAQVIYDEMKLLAPKNKTGVARKYRGKTYEPGHLKKSIYQVFAKNLSGVSRVVFHVGPNMKKAGYWWLVEHGHWTTRRGKYGPLQPTWVPGQPYIARAWELKGSVALATTLEGIKRRLKERRG